MLKRKIRVQFSLAAIAVCMLFIAGCNKDDDNTPPEEKYNISGNASGALEVPAVTTSGTGTITGIYDALINKLEYTITWTGLSGTVNNMHFHGPADPTISVGVQIAIAGWSSTAAGTITSTADLSDVQEADLLAGKWYYNIHSTFKGSGEIRGNITAVRR